MNYNKEQVIHELKEQLMQLKAVSHGLPPEISHSVRDLINSMHEKLNYLEKSNPQEGKIAPH